MKKIEKKELPYERVLFFSDAVVAIAITLLALDLKIDIPAGQPFNFTDLIRPWHKYLAFVLSFINILGFWNTHHQLFTYIKKMDGRLIWYNHAWLFFIVVLPFSTSILSDHITDTAAVFCYSLNIFLISILQNFLWDYSVLDRKGFIDPEDIDEEHQKRYQVMFNLDMLNGLVSVIVCFFAPLTAFILLFFKIPLLIFASFYIASKRRKEKKKR
ncbi:TMEM175 family protein [Flavobacterium humi]|nr:TMEM175 family protein [Flavobacterium humi]